MRPDTRMDELLPEAEGLLVVPPFASASFPHLGVHLLQACARREGVRVGVFYASLAFAAEIGESDFEALCNAPGDWLVGERIFAAAAFPGLPRLGRDGGAFLEQVPTDGRAVHAYPDLEAKALRAAVFAERVGEAIARRGYRFVGCTTMFEQTAAAFALLGAVKRAQPEGITLLGGANCDGEMADGLAALGGPVDHIFSGESEASFVRWLRGEETGAIVRGAPCRDLDALPVPDFSDYFAQVTRLLPDGAPRWLSAETSRGCWWGETQHCTFCGLNGTGMGFRAKSPDRVLAELRTLVEAHDTRLVCLTDNIMPHAYHRTVIPRIPEEVGPLEIFYEQKANLRLDQVKGLRDAGCTVIQPGIESLSTPILQRMRKGVLARQNIALLRYARALGMGLNWNLLYGFPGDEAADYEALVALLPLLGHLCPPNGLSPLSIDRFSPYFDDAAAFGISALRPRAAYGAVFPDGAPLDRIAYHFEGHWQSGALDRPDLLVALGEIVGRWRTAWQQDATRPMLHVAPSGPGSWVLSDRRGLQDGVFWLSDAQAAAVLTGGPLERVAQADWAVRNRFAVALDGWCTPLATASYEVLAAMR